MYVAVKFQRLCCVMFLSVSSFPVLFFMVLSWHIDLLSHLCFHIGKRPFCFCVLGGLYVCMCTAKGSMATLGSLMTGNRVRQTKRKAVSNPQRLAQKSLSDNCFCKGAQIQMLTQRYCKIFW